MINTLLVIGAGRMGSALVQILRTTGRTITIMDKQQNNRDMGTHEAVILAVKPQSFRSSPTLFTSSMKQAGIVISIMAGVSLAELAMHAQHTRVVRIMPNMPVSIGAGMSVGIAHASVTDTTRAQIDDLWASTGALHWLEQESFMNAATAVSGCGPAYVFALIESLTDAAMAVGFDKATAYTLACHTVQGSARYAETSRATPTELMAEIASKGGVTEAALEVLRPELHTLMQRTITTAITRAEAITTPTGDSLN